MKKIEIHNWSLPVMIHFKPKSALFTARKPLISAIIVIGGKMHMVKLPPNELSRYPITSMAILKKPLGWTFETEELR